MSMSEWAENEVRIACKRENPDRKEGEFDYGCGCYESALKAYKSLCEDGHSGMSFGLTRKILIRLLNELPLTPIEDKEEVWHQLNPDTDNPVTYQCNRMGSLFKDVFADGTVKYHDNNRVVGVDLKTGSGYHGIQMSEEEFKYWQKSFSDIEESIKLVMKEGEDL